ncbi:hypothetical protein F4821DRAFT_256819 [Hypoxylon rubiginosum]|uniref:Uncharacterized protein n=1 Tax=Hypoxylon rubiginosum TaxID=110542 RepID=A0ACC0DBN8_9PEZI|nr:hypothetical protein F4821DRAFT_256819 [Hypoxylon rubiginosum]
MVSITLIAALLPLTALAMVSAKRPSDSSISYEYLHPDSQLGSSDAHLKTSITVAARDPDDIGEWIPSKGTNHNECGDTDWIGATIEGQFSNNACKTMSESFRSPDHGGFFTMDDMNRQHYLDFMFMYESGDDEDDWCVICFNPTNFDDSVDKSYGVKVGNLDIADLIQDGLAKQVFGGKMNCNSAKLNDAGQPLNQSIRWSLANTRDKCGWKN